MTENSSCERCKPFSERDAPRDETNLGNKVLKHNNSVSDSTSTAVDAYKITPWEAIRCRTWSAQRWIEADIAQGLLPPDVSHFKGLHSYVDGNAYLFDRYLSDTDSEEHHIAVRIDWRRWSLQEIIDHIAPVCEALDTWLRNGRSCDAVNYLKFREGQGVLKDG